MLLNSIEFIRFRSVYVCKDYTFKCYARPVNANFVLEVISKPGRERIKFLLVKFDIDSIIDYGLSIDYGLFY